MAAPKSAPALLSVSFNQDSSCISVGTRKGYAIANAEPFGRIYARDDGPTAIVEMLFCTSLVALVGTADSSPQSSPRRLQIVNTKVSSSGHAWRWQREERRFEVRSWCTGVL